jgi:hypothetical protein
VVAAVPEVDMEVAQAVEAPAAQVVVANRF